MCRYTYKEALLQGTGELGTRYEELLEELKKIMDIDELKILSSSKATDFDIQHVVGMGQNGLVVAAKCTRPHLRDPNKLYAVKLLFNFTHEYTSIIRNTYENEWLILSRLLPHENIVRFWAQFISIIPESFSSLLPNDIQKFTTHKNRSGKVVPSKGQFLVLDYHPQDLQKWSRKASLPLEFGAGLNLTMQLLNAVLFLEKNSIRHLDLKMSNLLISENNKLRVCDFGCAVQFPDETFTLAYSRGMLAGGNRAHIAPEVLSTHHRYRQHPPKVGILDYSLQASFAVGVLVCEIASGEHPLPDYPLGYTVDGVIHYTNDDIIPLPSFYPKSFTSIIYDLLQCDPKKRLSISEALNQIRVCCVRKQSTSSNTSTVEKIDMDTVLRERDLAKATLRMVAAERDFAISEMKEMAEQCQGIAEEFQLLADQHDQLQKEIVRVRTERDRAVKACESAYEASELLKTQLSLVSREKDLAQAHVEELRELTSKCHLEEAILECECCHKFYLESENDSDSCQWHSGVSMIVIWHRLNTE